MGNTNERHVVPNADGGWDVVAPGASRASSHHDTQAEAIDRGRQIVHNAGGGELRIHGRDGRIVTATPSPPATTPTPRATSADQTGRSRRRS